MKPLSDYNSIPEFTPIDTRKLPAGAYEITIKRAEEKNMNGEDYLCILFDISDGEYKDYFINKFMSVIALTAQGKKQSLLRKT